MKNMPKVLVVEDDRVYSILFKEGLTEMGYEALCVKTLQEGLKQAGSGDYDIVLLDLSLPDGNGLDHVEDFKAAPSTPEIIIVTGSGDQDSAEVALKSGAWNFFSKPFLMDVLRFHIVRALQYREARNKSEPKILNRFGIVGDTPKMENCLRKMAKAAFTNINVLITGETGTGKELFARAVHKNSARSQERFVVVDCAALAPSLAESILFGHEKGAFTGADRSREGLVCLANGGTLFLDEVGELPLELQKNFLRVLQERRYRPLGSKSERDSDFRLITATNRNLQEMVVEGTFRGDLLFRLSSMTIELPPLREQPEIIGDLALYYIRKICEKNGMSLKGISPDFLEHLLAYSWPGNFREFINTIEYAVAESHTDPILFQNHLPLSLRMQAIHLRIPGAQPAIPEAASAGPLPSLKSLREAAVRNIEIDYLSRLLERSDYNLLRASQLSGISRPHLYGLLKKHQLNTKIPS